MKTNDLIDLLIEVLPYVEAIPYIEAAIECPDYKPTKKTTIDKLANRIRKAIKENEGTK